MKLAADNGDPYAQRNLGLLYKIKEELDLAEHYLKLAADNGDFEAQAELANLYSDQGRKDLAEHYHDLAYSRELHEIQEIISSKLRNKQ